MSAPGFLSMTVDGFVKMVYLSLIETKFTEGNKMSDYQARITETADGSFYALVVMVDYDEEVAKYRREGKTVKGVYR